MYFTDWGTVGRIERATFDGRDRVAIHNTNLIWPNALTLDIPAQTMYWADASLDKIEKSLMDGRNRELLTQSGVNNPFAIVLENDTLYFTDRSDQTIRSLDTSGGNVTVVSYISTFSSSTVFGIQIVDPSRQPVRKFICIANYHYAESLTVTIIASEQESSFKIV